jgi:thiosulfate dehydrogenase
VKNKRSIIDRIRAARARRACAPRLASAFFAAMMATALPAAAFQGPQDDTELGPTFLLSLGGKLYDDLWLMLDEKPPAGRNPAVPADAAVPDRTTWRCVACHGWSYSGAEIGGAIFPGLRDLAEADPDSIKDRIRDPAHPFPADVLPELSLDLLAYFISDGLYEPADFIDDTRRSVGDPELGQAIFEGACIGCHQLDGRRFLEGEHGDRSSLGWVARERPEQALHKILNGVPAAEMLSLRFLTREQIAHLFAYLQALDASEQ